MKFPIDKDTKKTWAIKGDRNTSFFHHSILKRARRNHITHLHNPDGTTSTTPDQLADTLTLYFTEIFTSNNLQGTHGGTDYDQLGTISNHVLVNDDYTLSVPDLQEIHNIVKHIRSNAAPGPDGLNAAFYKAAWS